jgi:hypothetical protein
MLAFIGFPLEDYLLNIPTGEINTHIARCRACKDKTACDHCLREQDPACDLTFCPNMPSLMACNRSESIIA